jgi:capsid protein
VDAPTPSILDRFIGYVSPKWGMEREAWRSARASYKGGIPTRRSESWGSSDQFRFESAGSRQQLMDARNRAVNAYQNNPVARTLVQTECDNVIGDGLNYQPTSDDDAWNKEAKDRYYEWLEQCTVRGPDILSGCEFQRMAWEQSRVAGDVGWILVAQGPESRVQMVPSESIVTPDDAMGDESIFDGIRFDALGRPVTYYVKYDDERGRRSFEGIGARDFVFLSHMTKPNQARGVTCYMTIFDLLANLDRYVDGVGLAAWMATVFGLIYKDASATKQLSGLPFTTNSGGNQQRALRIEQGMVKYMAPEGEVVQVDAKQPMQQTPEFIRAMYRMLGQPFDMPLEVIAKDMSACTFASARIGLLPFYRSCRIKAGRFGSRWSRTIKWWLSREQHRAQDDPKRWRTKFPANYWSHDLFVNEWPYTDPVSEVQGDMLQCDMGIKSKQMVIAERGRDAAQIIADREQWEADTDGLPEVHSTMTRDPTPEPLPPANPPAQPTGDPNANP